MPDLLRIELTKDEDLRAKLRKKLDEYDERYQYQAPEVDAHATFKWRLLRKLVADGAINVEAERIAASAMCWFNGNAFDGALGVIDAYNNNEAFRLHGGTGL